MEDMERCVKYVGQNKEIPVMFEQRGNSAGWDTEAQSSLISSRS